MRASSSFKYSVFSIRTAVQKVSATFKKVKKATLYSLSPQQITLLFILAATGPVIYQMLTLSLVGLNSGYNMLRDAVSLLLLGPFGWVQTGAFCIFGVSVTSLAFIVSHKFRAKFNAASAFLILSGIGFILLGTNGTVATEQETLSGLVHLYSAISVMVIFPIACFLFIPLLKSEYRILGIYTGITGIFGLLFFFIGGQFLGATRQYVGIYERVMLWNGQIWVEIVCAYLLLKDMGN